MKKEIYTIGHSTRTLHDFFELLNSNGIKILADVRSYPGSKRFPHFNKENLQISLPEEGIKYIHIKELGGRRKLNPGSNNSIWKNRAFRAYADFMETEEFKKGIEILTSAAESEVTSIMCSEAVWWKCHRSMISDYLKFKEWKVIHIMGKEKNEEHPFTRQAKILNGDLFYGK
jgi:uncharacterized protein (DUF488 family)